MASFFQYTRKRLMTTLTPQTRSQIQIMSDLHLEVCRQYSTFTFPASAPLLLLAGDIGRLIDFNAYRDFLASQAARYQKVFLILGNHEFYGPSDESPWSYEAGLDTARRLAEDPSLASKLVLLHRTRWDDPESDLTILGCTLWSAIPEEAVAIVERKVSDFKMIDGWTAASHNAVHQEEVAWLREQVAQVKKSNPERRILVATHHAPCIKGTSQPEHVKNPWSSAFATDLLKQGGWEGVTAWVFGHTHYSTRLKRNGIKLVANQRGYVFPGANARRVQYAKAKDEYDFDASLVISV